MSYISFRRTNSRQIVDQQSATLGFPVTQETQIGIHADHSHMCKFDHEQDHAYEQVSENLVELIGRAIDSSRELQVPTASHQPVKPPEMSVGRGAFSKYCSFLQVRL